MQFTPKTEKQLSEARLLPQGIFPFEVIEASDTKSKKSGAEMIKVKLNVFASERSGHVYDYLSNSFMEYKLRHFCFSVGLGSSYEAGTLTARQCLGRQGYVKIGFEDGKDGFKDKNIAEDYEIPASETPPEPPEEVPSLPAEPPATTSTEVPIGEAPPALEPVTRATDAQLKGEEPMDDVPF